MTRPTGRGPHRMPGGVRSLPTILLAAIVLSGCERQGGDQAQALLSAPPVPANLAELDDRVVQRIDDASARVTADPDQAQAWADLAMVLQAERMRQQAATCYEQALARDPDQPKWWYWLSSVHDRLGESTAAIDAAARSIALEPDYAPSHYRLGTYRLERGELEPAAAAFQRATELDPDYPGGWVGLARVHLQRDENDEAVAVLERLQTSHPDDVQIKRLLVTAYRQAGVESELDPVVAIQDEGQVWGDPWEDELFDVRQDPEMRRIGMLLQEGQASVVIPLLEAKRVSEPEATHFLPQLAEAYYQMGRTKEARQTYRQVLVSEPANVPARMALARILLVEERAPGAIARLDEVIEIQPRYAKAHEMKGWILYEQGQFEAALPELRTALELDQRNPKVRVWIGFALLGLSEWEQARQEFVSLLDEDTQNGDAYLGLGKAQLKLRRLDEAAASLARAEELGTQESTDLEIVKQSLATARARQEQHADDGH